MTYHQLQQKVNSLNSFQFILFQNFLPLSDKKKKENEGRKEGRKEGQKEGRKKEKGQKAHFTDKVEEIPQGIKFSNLHTGLGSRHMYLDLISMECQPFPSVWASVGHKLSPHQEKHAGLSNHL